MSRPTSISGTSSNLTALAARPPARARWLLAALALLLLAAAPRGGASTFPPLSGRVVDQADLLQPGAGGGAQRRSWRRCSAPPAGQLVVATVASLQGMPIEDYGYQLGRHWRHRPGRREQWRDPAGRAERDAGCGSRSATGSSRSCTDALSSQIIQQQILPRFRGERLSRRDHRRRRRDHRPARRRRPRRPSSRAGRGQRRRPSAAASAASGAAAPPWPLIFWIGVILFIVIGAIGSGLRGRRYRAAQGRLGDWARSCSGASAGSARRRRRLGRLRRRRLGRRLLGRRRRRSSWGGGGGGGGFSGGGGSFGGGGASGGW